MRQYVVEFILWAWPIMPRRLKLWAFMNDEMPEDDRVKKGSGHLL